jgi:hypothetical protein
MIAPCILYGINDERQLEIQMPRKSPHTQVAVKVDLVDQIKIVAERNHRSVVGEVAVAITAHLESQAARETDMARG